MNATPQPAHSAHIATAFYQSRDTAKFVLGEHYADRMQELGEVLQKVATGRRTGTLNAAQDVIRAADLSGFDAIQVLAAAVELAEPSARQI